MSAEPGTSMNEAWANLEGQVVNGVFPLLRYLGSGARSGVFLTRSAKHDPRDVALKLVAVDPALAEVQLSRWRAVADLAHPHLLRLFEAGWCQVGGLDYLYVVMEYADQTLAQLLEHRALADDEARETLAPMLSALAFLHDRKLAQGGLKPSNVLVVGDQLKLSSDTVRATGEGSASAAGDIRALGITMCEALTRRQPSDLNSEVDLNGEVADVVLPSGLSPAFRELVAWCLSPGPRDRPEVDELQAWLRGEHTGHPADAPAQPAAAALQPSKRRAVPLVLGAVAALVLAWLGILALRSHRTDAPVQAPDLASLPDEAAPEVIDKPHAKSGDPIVKSAPAGATADALPSAVHKEMPDVPRRAQQTIRGTIRVSVRVIVDPQRKVFAALVDKPGPSRYFERLAIDAAKQWTFAPGDTEGQRLLQVRFNFTRAGTTAQAIPLR